MLARALTLLALSCSALASISITNPIASTSLAGGKTLKVAWTADSDKTTPLASAFGNSSVSIYTGSSSTQYLLETFGYLNPHKTLSISKVVPKTLGPDATLYFIRIESLAATDSAGNPLEAFSARFTLTGMSGEFTAVESSANADVSVASSTAAAAVTTKASTKTSTKSASTRATSNAVNANAASSTTTVVAIVTAAANATSNTASSGGAVGAVAIGWNVVTGLAAVAGAMMVL